MAKSKSDVIAELQEDKDTKAMFTQGMSDKSQYYVHTGHYGLNRVVSGMYWGGWASGRVAELYGDPSTGKSILFMAGMRSMQKGLIYVVPDAKVRVADSYVLLDDTEKVYVESFCNKLDFNVLDVLELNSTQTVESHFQYAISMVKKINKVIKSPHTIPIGIFCDSVAQLSTVHERKVGLDKKDMTKAGALHAAWRVYSNDVNDYQVVYLLANHVIANVGVMYGPKTTVKGGSGTPFQASVRVELKYKSRMVRNVMETVTTGKRGDVYGNRIVASAAKNKVTIPHQFTAIDVYYDFGIDPYSGLQDHFVRQGQLTSIKKTKTTPDLLKFKGYDQTFEDKDFEAFIIDNDILQVKAHGMEYAEPIRQKLPEFGEEFEEGLDSIDTEA